MNDPEQLKELKEREKKAREEAELKKQEEEEKRQMQDYGPGGRFGAAPSITAITQVLVEQERVRRAFRQKQRAERLAKLKAEKEEAGEDFCDEEEIKKILEDEDEDVDYTVIMAEEETVPEGQKDNDELELDLKGVKMKQIIRQMGRLVKLMPQSTLPKKLPDNLVYWNRCETRIESQKLVTYSHIQHFQKAQIFQYEDKKACEKVAKGFPFIDDVKMWADPARQKYVNKHEKAILTMRKFPPSQRKYETEGYIKFQRIRPFECLFNSRFESGNLRQVFKVPREIDFDMVPIEEEIPDYLPEEVQEIRREENKQKKQARQKDRLQKHIAEENEDEIDMKLPPNQRQKTYEGIYTIFKDEKPPEEEEEHINADLDILNTDDENDGNDSQPEVKKKTKRVKKRELGKTSCEYNLYLQDDLNADSANFQWFYFSVMNIRQGTQIKINICNMAKPNNLYNKGMKPFIYSMNKKKQTGVGWHRGGENVRYSLNGQFARLNKKTLDAYWIKDGTLPCAKDSYKELHKLSFEYRFESDYDIVFFAHFQPYTYTDLVNFLCTLKSDEEKQDKMRLDYLCHTIGGAPVYGLTITNNIDTNFFSAKKEIQKYQRFEYDGVMPKPRKVKYKKDLKSKVEETPQQASELHVSDDDSSQNKSDQIADEKRAPFSLISTVPISTIPIKEDDTSRINVSKLQLTENTFSEQKVETDPKDKTADQVTREGDESALVNNVSQVGRKTSLTQTQQVPRMKTDRAKLAINQALYETHFSTKGVVLPKDAEVKDVEQEKFYKKYLFLTSRVHPGESQSSHIVHGMIEWLLSDDPEADEIREKFVVKIVPMLNPDGVIYGHSRVSLLGVDLNRRWHNPSKFLHPTVYYTKQIIKYYNLKGRQPGCDSGGVVLSCDIHGHSRSQDVFTYNCKDEVSMNNLTIRAVSFGIDKRLPIFNLNICKFSNEKDKENTARIVLYKELGILSSFTLECTYFGSEFFRRQKQGHFLLTREQQEYQTERYNIALNRKDIQIDERYCHLIGEDVLQGLNYASKKRPLLQYWFRLPPKNQIELFGHGNQKDNEIDQALLELEKAWKPLGNIRQDKHLGIGDRFEERYEVQAQNRPPSEARKGRKIDLLDVALIDKLKKLKKAKKKKNFNQDGLGILTEKDGVEKSPRDYSNADMAEFLNIDKNPSKLKQRKRLKNPKRKNSSSHRNGLMAYNSNKRKRNSNASITMDDPRSNDFSAAEDARSAGRKVPILLRDHGGSAMYDSEDDDDDDLDDEDHASQHIYSSATGFELKHVKKMLKTDGQFMTAQMKAKLSPDDSSNSSDQEQQIYLKSKDLDQLDHNKSRHSRGIFSTETNKIKVTRKKSGNSSKGTSKRQLNLSVRMKDGKTQLKVAAESDRRLPRIESQIETNSVEDDDDDQRHKIMNFSTFRRNNSRSNHKREHKTVNQLKDLVDLRLRKDQLQLYQTDIGFNKKNLIQQVSDQDFDGAKFSTQFGQSSIRRPAQGGITIGAEERMRKTDIASRCSSIFNQIQMDAIFRKNKLSVDPIVLPTSKLEKISKIQMKTMERQTSSQFLSLKSPKRTIGARKKSQSPGKFIFAPQNGVYTHTQLLQNPQLAKQQNINFMVTTHTNNSQTQNSFHHQSYNPSPQSTKMIQKMNKTGAFMRQLKMAQNSKTDEKFRKFMSPDPKRNTLQNSPRQNFSLKGPSLTQYTSEEAISSTQQTKAFPNVKGVQQNEIYKQTLSNISSQQQTMKLPTEKSVKSLLRPSPNDGNINNFEGSCESTLAPLGNADYFDEHDMRFQEHSRSEMRDISKNQQQHLSIIDMLNKDDMNQKLDDTIRLPNLKKDDHDEMYGMLVIKNRRGTEFLESNGQNSRDLGSNTAPPYDNTGGIQLNQERIDLELTSSDSSIKNTAKDNQIELPPLQSTDKAVILKKEPIELEINALTQTISTKKYLQMKNGFEFANNLDDRQLDKLLDVRKTNRLRDRQRKKSRPQFVIKPLDQRDFLKIQLQHVNQQSQPSSPEIKKPIKQLSKQKKLGIAGLRKTLKTRPPSVQLGSLERDPASNKIQLTQEHGKSTGINVKGLVEKILFEGQGALSPKFPYEKRHMSVGKATQKSISLPNCLSEKKRSQPALLMPGLAAIPEATAAKESYANALRDREFKSVAVHNLVNQTMVYNNKLLVFKPQN